MTDQEKMPPQVEEVWNALHAAAVAADKSEPELDGFNEECSYASKDDDEWRVGVDMEGRAPGSHTLVMRGDKWYRRNSWDGEDKEISHTSAVANAAATFG